MSVLLFRVDERLIHGQVVVGWGRPLGVRRIVVVDDRLAAEPGEQEIYRTGLPESMRAEFWTVETAVDRLPEAVDDDVPTVVLTEDLATMWRLAVEGVPIEEVNVGGLHAGPGRRRVLPYVCLAPEEEDRVRSLEAAGVRVTARDVPGAESVRLAERRVWRVDRQRMLQPQRQRPLHRVPELRGRVRERVAGERTDRAQRAERRRGEGALVVAARGRADGRDACHAG